MNHDPFSVRARIGYMPEGDSVMPEMTALKYTTFAAELCGLPASEATGRAHQVLHYVEQLNELDVSQVEPTAHAFPVYNVLRKDEVGQSLNHDDVISNAPSATDGEIRVPKIIDQ